MPADSVAEGAAEGVDGATIPQYDNNDSGTGGYAEAQEPAVQQTPPSLYYQPAVSTDVSYAEAVEGVQPAGGAIAYAQAPPPNTAGTIDAYAEAAAPRSVEYEPMPEADTGDLSGGYAEAVEPDGVVYADNAEVSAAAVKAGDVVYAGNKDGSQAYAQAKDSPTMPYYTQVPGRSRVETINLATERDEAAAAAPVVTQGTTLFLHSDDDSEGSDFGQMSATTEDILFGLLAQEEVRKATVAAKDTDVMEARARAVASKKAQDDARSSAHAAPGVAPRPATASTADNRKTLWLPSDDGAGVLVGEKGMGAVSGADLRGTSLDDLVNELSGLDDLSNELSDDHGARTRQEQGGPKRKASYSSAVDSVDMVPSEHQVEYMQQPQVVGQAASPQVFTSAAASNSNAMPTLERAPNVLVLAGANTGSTETELRGHQHSSSMKQHDARLRAFTDAHVSASAGDVGPMAGGVGPIVSAVDYAEAVDKNAKPTAPTNTGGADPSNASSSDGSVLVAEAVQEHQVAVEALQNKLESFEWFVPGKTEAGPTHARVSLEADQPTASASRGYIDVKIVPSVEDPPPVHRLAKGKHAYIEVIRAGNDRHCCCAASLARLCACCEIR